MLEGREFLWQTTDAFFHTSIRIGRFCCEDAIRSPLKLVRNWVLGRVPGVSEIGLEENGGFLADLVLVLAFFGFACDFLSRFSPFSSISEFSGNKNIGSSMNNLTKYVRWWIVLPLPLQWLILCNYINQSKMTFWVMR